MTERTDGAVDLGGGIEDLERRLAALEAQMRIVRTVMVPVFEDAMVRLLRIEEQLRRLAALGGGR